MPPSFPRGAFRVHSSTDVLAVGDDHRGSGNGSGSPDGGDDHTTTSPQTTMNSSAAPLPTSFPSQPMNGCFSCTVHDNDARLMYKGNWSLNGTPTSTTHSTIQDGASVSFAFNGSGIFVFGTVSQSNSTIRPPTASYIVDAQQPVITTQPTASISISDQPLFFAGGLSTEEHLFTIVVGSDSAQPFAPYTLQRLFVFPNFPAVGTNSATQAADYTLTPTSTLGDPTTTSSSPSTTSSMDTSPSSTTIRVLAGTLGTLVVLIIILISFFVCYYRRGCARMRRSNRWSRSAPSISPSSSSEMQERTILTTSESILRHPLSGIFSLYTRSEHGRGSVVDYYLSLPSPPPAVPHYLHRVSLPPDVSQMSVSALPPPALSSKT